jgi:hypothetical protein
MNCVQNSARLQAVGFIANFHDLAECKRQLIKATLESLRQNAMPDKVLVNKSASL